MEDYKEKYEQLIKRIKHFHETVSPDWKKVIENHVPELKEESEDERIRKELIEHIKANCASGFILFQKFSPDDVIAWLEKQGNVKHTCRNCQTFQDMHQNCPYSPIHQYTDLKEAHKHLDDETHCEFWLEKQGEPIDEEEILIGARKRIALSIMDFLDRNTLGMCLSSMECKGLEDAVVGSDWLKVYNYMKKKLEKQDEQPNKVSIWKHWNNSTIGGNGEGKLIYLVKIGNTYSLSSCLGFECDYIELSELDKLYVERQGEQKPTDKAEPNFNFKVGQWIVAVGKCVFLITKIDGFNVTLVDVNGNESVFDAGSLDDAHLWTIQDANDGDVLASEGVIGIFESLGNHPDGRTNNDNSYCNLHCRFDDFFYADFESGNIMDSSYNIHPATKEQRDLLFQKMKEAGYEWDSEKRELTKIESKFKVGDWIVEPREDEPDYLWHIDRIEDDTYWYDAVNAGVKVAHADKNYHLWTVNDAKEGDVLSCENGWTCIFKALDNHTNTFSSYCFMDKEGWLCEDGGQAHTIDNRICGEIHPATQEQRDLLFQKIKESGYEWDAEKKELRNMLCNDTER